MPTETRQLTFSDQEIRVALINYALRTDMRLPKDSIEKVRVARDTGVVTFVYAPGPDGEAREVTFTEKHVAAAIVLYCRTHAIPLPPQADKLVKSEGRSVSMMMRVRHEVERPGRSAEAARAAPDAGGRSK